MNRKPRLIGTIVTSLALLTMLLITTLLAGNYQTYFADVVRVLCITGLVFLCFYVLHLVQGHSIVPTIKPEESVAVTIGDGNLTVVDTFKGEPQQVKVHLEELGLSLSELCQASRGTPKPPS